jgi:small subunit ribosomal protein S15
MLTKRKKQNVIKEARVHDTDTGSPEVRASMLTKQIEELSGHLKKHPKDTHSRRGLIGMVAKRHTALKYLQKKNPQRYAAITKKLGLKQK